MDHRELRHRLSAAAVRAGRRSLADAEGLRDGPVRLDGGASTTLADAGHDLTGALWSARLLITAPTAVSEVHAAFLDAGAEVVTTLSYQLAAKTLAAAGHDPGDAPEFLARSVEVAREAVAAAPRPALVGASVGAYGAALGHGAEYTGGYGVGPADLAAFHRPRIEALTAAGADVLVCETIPSATEIEALREILADVAVPATVSVTLAADGRHLPEGVELVPALAPVAELDNVVAVGVNCVHPDVVDTALRELTPLGVPLLAKPNAEAVDELDPRPWLDAGAAIVGGCCGTSPARLRQLLARVEESAPPG